VGLNKNPGPTSIFSSTFRKHWIDVPLSQTLATGRAAVTDGKSGSLHGCCPADRFKLQLLSGSKKFENDFFLPTDEPTIDLAGDLAGELTGNLELLGEEDLRLW
jgi:hypothetical protein